MGRGGQNDEDAIVRAANRKVIDDLFLPSDVKRD